MKKIIAFVLALTLCLGLTGCGALDSLLGGGDPIISYETTDYQTPGSHCYSLLGKLTVKSGKVKIPMKLEASGRVTEDPARSYLDISVGAMMIKVHNEIYTEERDGRVYTYTGLLEDNGTSWETSSVEKGNTEFGIQYLPEFLEKLTEMEKTGTAKAATGEKGDLYEGYVSADRIREALDFILSMEPGQKSEEAREELEEILSGMDPNTRLPVTVIMDGDQVLEFYMDMMPLSQKLLDGRGNEETQISEFFLRVNFWNYGSAQPIEIPQEARD